MQKSPTICTIKIHCKEEHLMNAFRSTRMWRTTSNRRLSIVVGHAAALFALIASMMLAPASALANSSTFSSTALWSDIFSDTLGWSGGPEYWLTIRFPDVNGDGKADACGRSNGGIVCAISTGSSFSAGTLWETNFSDSNGWNSDSSYWNTIQFPDVNGDGKADVCGRGSGGIACALSTGSLFSAATHWNTHFGNAYSWNSDAAYWKTIRFPDVNGDGKADVCGRDSGGITCALSTGYSFLPISLWETNFSDAKGWKSDPSYWETIRFPDVNGDRMADVCGRGSGGIACALSTGTSFSTAIHWNTDFSDGHAWNNDPAYWGTIRFPDVNGDGSADVCGRRSSGIDCAVSNGHNFSSATLWSGNFSDLEGWLTDPTRWGTIQFPDVNGDGSADVCGRSEEGILCGLSTGAVFSSAVLWNSDFSDDNGWNVPFPANWSSIKFPDVNGNGNADVCGRGADGIMCARAMTQIYLPLIVK